MSVKSRFPVYVRGIALVLLFAMFHYVAGYRLLYSMGILYAKDEAKTCMTEKNNTKKFSFSSGDYTSLKWTEKNKEFSFHNQMYDVLNIEKAGDIYTVSVYADDPETELVTAFHHFENELFHPDQSNKSTKSAEDIMSSFQKEFTPISEFKINIFSATRLFQSEVATHQYPLQIANSIWHPPLFC
jgi:hypothetical protein